MKIILNISLLVVLFFSAYGCSSEGEAQPSKPDPTVEEPNQVSLDSTKAIYRQFSFRGSHNSYSGNQNGMKREGIKTQLEKGLRFFEFDLYSYHTQNILKRTWTEDADVLTVFDYLEKTELLTYSKTSGIIKIYNVTTGGPQQIYENIETPVISGKRVFATLAFNGNLYVFSYHQDSGDLTIYNFENNKLSTIYSGYIKASQMKLFPFAYNNHVYLAQHDLDDSTYKIQAVSLASNTASLNETVYNLNAVSSEDNLTPFQQDNKLYIFRHNVNYVTSFTVETINTTGNLWSKNSSITDNSSLLSGRVETSYSNGKLFINAYTANGNIMGSQLIMDNEKPNIVNECTNDIELLAGAQSNVFPCSKGYYLFLKKDSNIQLSVIDIGTLVLGHDAPGDEVDLTVDNPQSIVLADWIAYMSNWSNEHPNHEPLFIMTELKDYEQWMADAKWQNIIKLMQENFGNKLRYHNSSGFQNESIVDQTKIVDGKTLYFMDENGSKEGGLLGKVVLYIQPNNNITKSDYTNNFKPFNTTDGMLQENFMQLKRYRINNKLVSPDWRYPSDYGGNLGNYIDQKDDSYVSRIFHMENAAGDGQYDNIHCTNVMFAVSDRPFDNGLYQEYVNEQKVKNKLVVLEGCNK